MIKKRTFIEKIVISAVFAILLIGLYTMIFAFSAQDGEESGSLSILISEKCVEFLNTISGKKWTESVMNTMVLYFEHPLRKLAHFTEYALMGIFIYGLLRPWMEKGRRLYLLIVFWVMMSAAADEIHQLFVPDRYGSLMDVLLDTCGGIFGVFCQTLMEKLIKKK